MVPESKKFGENERKKFILCQLCVRIEIGDETNVSERVRSQRVNKEINVNERKKVYIVLTLRAYIERGDEPNGFLSVTVITLLHVRILWEKL